MLKSKSKFKILPIVAGALILAAPFVAGARGLIPCGGEGENPCTVADIFVLIARVTNWLIMWAGVFAVYQFISNAFWMVVSMGNEEAITKRRSALGNAIMGLVVVFMAYMLINTAVNILLLQKVKKCRIKLSNPL
ncbi:MAG: hypothetical protein ABIL22_08755, partial [candidate division WOR-3 bacterium]